MAKDILAAIEERMPHFSKGQRRIARYIVDEYDKAAFLTAAKLGKTVGTSESTVVRFAYEMGFEGYPQLQRALQEMIRNKLTAVQRIELIEEAEDTSKVLGQVLGQDIDRIKRTLEEVNRADFAASVEALGRARSIYIIGVRTSSILAGFLGFYLGLIFDNVRVVDADGAGEIFEKIVHIGAGDVIIGISFPRYSRRTAQAVRYGKERGATAIALTDSEAAPVAQYADYLLTARSEMASFVDSLVPPLSLINALVVAAGLGRKEKVAETFSQLEYIWEQYRVFEKPGEEEAGA